MFQKTHLPDWIVFFLAGGSLYIVYRFDAKRLLETLLQWTFAVYGVKLLIDYGLIKGLFSEERIDTTMRKIPIFTSLSMKRFKYNHK